MIVWGPRVQALHWAEGLGDQGLSRLESVLEWCVGFMAQELERLLASL